MNCKNVEELLPLYVGRDLEEERARLITAHVQTCTECARSAQEYGEANQLLQLFEPPQFSEATYAAVRSRVLREIERESSAPQKIFALEFLRRAFQPRVMWAVSTAVLLAVCVFAYYFIANRTKGQRYGEQIAENRGAVERNTRDEQANAEPQSDHFAKDLTADVTGTAGGRGPRPGSPAGVLDPPASATSSPKSPLNQTAWHSRRAGGAPAVPVRSAQYSPVEPNAGPLNPPVTSEKTLRLEIQTSDRNIRIIWFSHPSTNEGSPNESSKGI